MEQLTIIEYALGYFVIVFTMSLLFFMFHISLNISKQMEEERSCFLFYLIFYIVVFILSIIFNIIFYLLSPILTSKIIIIIFAILIHAISISDIISNITYYRKAKNK